VDGDIGNADTQQIGAGLGAILGLQLAGGIVSREILYKYGLKAWHAIEEVRDGVRHIRWLPTAMQDAVYHAVDTIATGIGTIWNGLFPPPNEIGPQC
jgi:hypothetical protein